ncbi:MAG: hypothetical protein JSU68_11625 [Phycisphaerales bacterium]|nr:MAG: hypothetical protein JSU68_11625 [Phycisphaerales bacterium]
MRTLSVLLAALLIGAVTDTASAQALNFADLLAMLGGPGGSQPGTLQPGDTPVIQPPGGGDGGAQPQEDLPIPQESLGAARNRRPGTWVSSGIATYLERTAHVGRLGPYNIPEPDAPEKTKVLPIIINDLLGSFFDIMNTAISGLNVFIQLQAGLGTSGSGAGGVDFNALLQQLLGSQSRPVTELSTEAAVLPPSPPVESAPVESQSVVVPLVPSS